MDPVIFHSIWTVLMLVLFVGIWVWAWSGKRKRSFDVAARTPLDDEAPPGRKKVVSRGAAKSKQSPQRKRVVRKNG